MIAFRHINQFEITGNVDTDSKFVSSLKVSIKIYCRTSKQRCEFSTRAQEIQNVRGLVAVFSPSVNLLIFH